MRNLAIVILAAGEGTRMKSDLPKVLHTLAGRPLVEWVLSSVSALRPDKIVMVVGHKGKEVMGALAGKKLSFVEQKQQFGSGHALRQAEKTLKNFRGDVLVLCADTPLIDPSTLKTFIAAHRAEGSAATVLTSRFDNPFGYGRVVRGKHGQLEEIVEEKDATPEERRIKEINSGIYCLKSPGIWKVLGRIKADNRKKEYYLTDAIGILRAEESPVGAYPHVSPREIIGINTRLDLAQAEEIVRQGTLKALMLDGVTVIDPGATYVSIDARIGRDTVLYPGTTIEGKTLIGEGCRIGPSSFVQDSRVGNGTEIRSSFVYESEIGDDVKIGPFAHLRPGAKIEDGARVGNFSEVKNSTVKAGAKVNHLSYIGDAYVGKKANIGAGTITCNYDGVRKNKTYIGDRTFVGSNVNLVAPVSVGPDVVLGAGSTITENVPAASLAIARARQVNKKRKK